MKDRSSYFAPQALAGGESVLEVLVRLLLLVARRPTVAAEAERCDHHPGIWNEYGYVRLELSSHDAGNRVTARDERLARAIDLIADGFIESGQSAAS